MPRPTPAVPAEELSRVMGEIAALLEAEVPPQEFFHAFCQKIMQVTGAAGAAVWQRDPKTHLQRLHETNFQVLRLEAVENGAECHALLLEDTALNARTTWVPPQKDPLEGNVLKANLSSWALLLAPILVEKKVVGVLEVVLKPEHDRNIRKLLARLVSELAGFAAVYLHKSQWRQLQKQQQLWQEIEAFAARIHDSLDPREIAYLAANDGKKLLGCDQVSVALRQGSTCRVAAVSGSVGVDRNSPLLQALAALSARVAAWGEMVHYAGAQDESLPPKVAQALDHYVAQSNCVRLVAAPLADSRRQGSAQACGVLVAECFDAALELERLPERIAALQRHVAPALANAMCYDQLPLRWLSVPLARLRDGWQDRGPGRFLPYAAVMVVALCLLTFLKLPLRSQATGHMAPTERRIVYSHLNGKIVHLAVQHGDRVDKGQELAFVEDLEAQLKLDQLQVKISSSNQKLALYDDQLAKSLGSKERQELQAERLKAHFELSKAKMERQLLLAEYRNPRKAPIIAPVSGQILTFDAKEKLLGKAVKPGEALLRLAKVDGPWDIELLLPEREVGQVRDALAASSGGTLEVELLLASDPHRTYLGELTLEALGGETLIHDNKVVLPARVAIKDRALSTLLDRMPVGVEVHARIQCGHASAGYVWFSELWNFVYERFLF